MRGFKIGKLFGISIRVDWSWLFIFLLIAFNLAASFSQTHPDWSGPLRWGIAIGASLLFFASVLAHEFAHSLVARARGLPVRSITLFLFGGVSNIQREPNSPGDEFLLTIVGPITSLVIGFGLVFGISLRMDIQQTSLETMTRAIGNLNPLATLLLWLGSVNVFVGLLNLIPGFPLDGGRIVRSILWAITDNVRIATRWASWLGQLIAWTMIGVGVAMIFGLQFPILGTGIINGVWLIFIGWFLNGAAIQSYRQIIIQDILEDVPVEEMMRSNVHTVSTDLSVHSLVNDYIMEFDELAFPVVEGSQLVGIVTLEDIRSSDKNKWSEITVADIMTPRDKLVLVPPGEDASEAFNELRRNDIRQILVVQKDQLLGVLRRKDIVRWLQFHSETQL